MIVLIVFGCLFGGCITCGVIGSIASKKNSAVTDAGPANQTWDCIGGEKVTAKCSVGPGCALMRNPILCPSHYVDLRGSSEINNWEKDGKWTTLKSKVAIAQFKDLNDDEKNAKCKLARRNADVHVCGAPAGSDFFGLVRLDRYEQGALTDDLWVTVLPDATTGTLQTAMNALALMRRASAADATATDKLDLLDAVRGPKDDGTKRIYAEVLTSSAFDLAVIESEEASLRAKVGAQKAAADENKKKDEEARRAGLADDPFERMLAVSESLSDLDDESWAIPPRGACGTDPPGDEFARRNAEATRADRVRALGRRLFHLNTTAEKGGEYDLAARVQKIKLETNDNYALASDGLVKTESLMVGVCCNVFTGACRPADGWITDKCENPAEELRHQSMGTSTSLSDKAKETLISVPLKPEDAERLKDAAWSAEVIVAVSSAVRLCDEDKSVRDSLFSGRIVGLRVHAGSEVVQRKADVKVTVEQAEQGAEAWAKGK